MKLVFYEFKKIFSFRIFVICLAVFFAFNIGLIWYSQSENPSAALVHSNAEKYNELIEKYSAMDYETAVNEIAQEKLVGDIAADILSASMSADSNMTVIIEENIRQYSQTYPDEFKRAQSIIESGYDEAYFAFINEISSKLEYVSNYDIFINQMEQRADNKLKFSAFSLDDGYSAKNIEKTAKDFQNLVGTSVRIGNDYFAVGATTFQITDYFILILIILLCIALFVTEKDKSLFTIVKSTKNGYAPTVTAKLVSLFVSVFLISLLFGAADIFTCGFYTGFGDVSRNIQSVSEFINCPFSLSIWQYLLLWVLSKTLVMCAAAAILSAIFVLIKSNSIIYIITLAFLALEYVLYTAIDSTAVFNHFKYINIFALLWDNNAIGNYLNLNFFGIPVTYSLIFIITLVLVILLFNAVSVLLYVKNIGIRGDKLTGFISARVSRFFSAHFNSVRLFSAEWHKYFFRGTTVFVLLFLIVFAYSQYTASLELKYYDPVDSCYAGYMNKLGGEIDDEKERFLRDEQEYFDGLEEQIAQIYADDSLSAEEKEIKASAISVILDGKGEAFGKVLEQYDYADKTAQAYDISPYFIDENISGILLSGSGREWEYFALTLAVMIISLSQIYSYEYKKKFIPILHSTRNGQLKLILSKTAVALISSAVTYILIYLPFTVNFISTYGFDMLKTPLIFVSSFTDINSTMTILQYIVLVSITRIFVFFAAAMLILGISVIVKNTSASMVVSTVITILPCMIFINNDSARFSSLFSSGIWNFAIPLIIVLSAVVSAVVFAVIVNKFGGIILFKRKADKNGAEA